MDHAARAGLDAERPVRAARSRARAQVIERRAARLRRAAADACLDQLDEGPREEPHIVVLAASLGGRERLGVAPLHSSAVAQSLMPSPIPSPPDLAGPEPQDLVDLARRTRAARGTSIRLIPTWSSIIGLDMSGDVLLPGPDARIAPTTFDDRLAGET